MAGHRFLMWGRLAACGGLLTRLRLWRHADKPIDNRPQVFNLPHKRSGQSTVEFALAYAGVVFPLMFALIYTSQLLWIWHGVNDFTRRGAGYAASHCWQASGGNVLEYMKANLPPVIDQNQFESGPAVISVSYFATDPTSGTLTPFTCDTDCDISCIPDTVTVSITGFSYSTFVTSLGLPAVPLPDFQTTVPIESAGCDPEQGICLP
ncbi:MAG TPA: TadE family protein [Bryobacteraceae bacterium]|nr:TadE family protein [Bryobacteraceae bacterium]